MPGPDNDKNKRIANLACQRLWGRDSDPARGDRWICEGGYFLYNQTCSVLIDNGPIDATDYDVLWFK